jgi:hypothetical protein
MSDWLKFGDLGTQPSKTTSGGSVTGPIAENSAMRSSALACDQQFGQTWVMRALLKKIVSGKRDTGKQLCALIHRSASEHPVDGVEQLSRNSNECL